MVTYYEIHGDGGTPLVLIHGGGSTIETSFGNILPLFAKRGKVIAVELQAHGRTGDRDAPESFEQDADDVAALMAHLQIDKANFLGFSNGGSTALQLGIRHSKLVHKLVVVAGGYKRAGFLPQLFEGLQGATLADMPEQLKAAYLAVAPDKNGFQTMFEKDRQRMLTFEDWPDEAIRSIQAPTLLMVADHDMVTVAHTLHMSQLIPAARLAVLPGVHGSFIGEVCTAVTGSKMAEVTVEVVEEFLKG